MPGELRMPLISADALGTGTAAVRNNYTFFDAVAEGRTDREIRNNWEFVDALSEGYPNLLGNYVIAEVLVDVWPEEYMSNDPFPSQSDLPGLTFTWHKRPSFRTNKHSSASGNSVRNALMEYPIWEFEGTYEFLRDGIDGKDEFKTLCGFFLARKGQFDSFLFKDTDDYLVENGSLGTGDAVTTLFYFQRSFGGFMERCGQVDTDETLTIYLSVAEPHTIPAGPGPFVITVDEAATYIEDLGVTLGGSPMTNVPSAPAAGEYSVDILTGIYTFNAADASSDVIISYRYEVDPADYTITMPNRVVFATAPPEDAIVSADFEFFFRCIFREDMMDFEKFAEKFWEVQTVEFESLPA